MRLRAARGQARERGALTFGKGSASGGIPRPGAPVLSSPDAGTPTADGTEGAAVTTDQGTGVLYSAVVTNGGTCTTAQIKAGTGGNIVVGTGASQVVGADGAQTIATITGLAGGTLYQIKFLHMNGDGKDSAQSSVNLTTL